MQVVERIAPAVVTKMMLDKFLTPRRKKDSDYTGRLPAGAQRVSVNHRNLELTGWRWEENGPSILVVHGWESHTGRMLPLIKPLVAQGCRVLALDAPGHGLSPPRRKPICWTRATPSRRPWSSMARLMG